MGPSSEPGVHRFRGNPVIGYLRDDDDDGHVGIGDATYVITPTNRGGGSGGHLVALRGATGEEVWDWWGAEIDTSLLLADVTGDGHPDVVTLDDVGSVVVLDAVGAELWRTAIPSRRGPLAQLAVGDLDGDGTVEVIADDLVVAGEGGTVLTTLVSSDAPTYDVDRGRSSGSHEEWMLALQLDGDPEGEASVVSGGETLFLRLRRWRASTCPGWWWDGSTWPTSGFPMTPEGVREAFEGRAFAKLARRPAHSLGG